MGTKARTGDGHRFWVTITLLLVAMPSYALEQSARSQTAIDSNWERLANKTRQQGFQPGAPLFIRIFKEESVLELWLWNGTKFALFKAYPICTWSGGLGPKLTEGDGQSPEGFYFVRPEQMNPLSSYHLSFNLGYPNRYDQARGRTGSYLMVHGHCVSIGCYAMTDPVIEEIWTIASAAFNAGQPFYRVHIFPFRMTEENMRLHSGEPWQAFWQNLKEGYDLFERTKGHLDVTVRSGSDGAVYKFQGD